MKPLTVAVRVLAISVIVLLLHDVDARGRGGGGRGGSSRGSSRSGWSSESKGSRGSSRTSSSRRGGSSLKLKITPGQLSAFFSHANVAKNGVLAVVIFGQPGN